MENKKFETTKQEKRVKLYGIDKEAILEVKRAGQCEIHVSDDVMIEARLHLPVNENDYDLLKKIEFGGRVSIIGRHLWGDWGGLSKNKTKTFSGKRYRELFKKGMEYLEEEIEKLNNALKKREQALIDAEY